MTEPVRLCVAGAGLIGRRHIQHIVDAPDAALASIVDPAPTARDLAERLGVAWFPDVTGMLARDRPDGVIVATPNQLHVDVGLAAIEAGLPTLVEKPLADTIEGGARLVEAAERKGVPLLTGHHRRYNPIIRHARDQIASGRLGAIVVVHAFFWLFKPDDYFDVPWRRNEGAGPVLLNLIHDVDLLRHLCGEIESVRALRSNGVRGHPVEETMVATLRFASGALGTVSVTDTAVAPWSWEHTTGENPVYPQTDQCCYFIGGTHGSLSLPRVEVWGQRDARSWWKPFSVERIVAPHADPLRHQVDHFCSVIRNGASPEVSGLEGLRTLRVVEALLHSARTGEDVTIAP